MNPVLFVVNGQQKIITQNACLCNKIYELPGLLNPTQVFSFYRRSWKSSSPFLMWLNRRMSRSISKWLGPCIKARIGKVRTNHILQSNKNSSTMNHLLFNCGIKLNVDETT